MSNAGQKIKVRLLLAEDDDNLGSLLQEYLVARNYEADWVRDGEKAFKAFEKNHYDLCILDVMMPVILSSRRSAVLNQGILPRVLRRRCMSWSMSIFRGLLGRD